MFVLSDKTKMFELSDSTPVQSRTKTKIMSFFIIISYGINI